MNYNIDDILALLNKGMTADEIAESFTNALNSAIKENEANNQKKEKIADADNLVKALNDFIKKYYPDTLIFDFTGEDFINAIDALVPEIKRLNKLTELFTPQNSIDNLAATPKKTTDNPAITPKKTETEDPIAYFLKSFGL